MFMGIKKLAGEEWRQVVGHRDYFVSDCGRVISDRRLEPKLMKPAPQTGGYLALIFCGVPGRLRGKQCRLVSRLVLEAFRGYCPEGCEASHLDGDRTNNKLDNLIWEVHLDNNQRKAEHGTQCRGETSGRSKLTESKVQAARWLFATGDYTYQTLADFYKVSRRTMTFAIQGKTWVHLS